MLAVEKKLQILTNTFINSLEQFTAFCNNFF